MKDHGLFKGMETVLWFSQDLEYYSFQAGKAYYDWGLIDDFLS